MMPCESQITITFYANGENNHKLNPHLSLVVQPLVSTFQKMPPGLLYQRKNHVLMDVIIK